MRGGFRAPEFVTSASRPAEGAGLVKARGTGRKLVGTRDRWVIVRPRKGGLRSRLMCNRSPSPETVPNPPGKDQRQPGLLTERQDSQLREARDKGFLEQ